MNQVSFAKKKISSPLYFSIPNIFKGQSPTQVFAVF